MVIQVRQRRRVYLRVVAEMVTSIRLRALLNFAGIFVPGLVILNLIYRHSTTLSKDTAAQDGTTSLDMLLGGEIPIPPLIWQIFFPPRKSATTRTFYSTGVDFDGGGLHLYADGEPRGRRLCRLDFSRVVRKSRTRTTRQQIRP